jgi:glycosyltransferase involved in cell wall biosynthesis
MKISIITPTFNSADKIERNVRSIIIQSHRDFEQIIVDNLSGDKTLEIIENVYTNSELKENIKLISDKDNGIADAFNKGINFCKGEIVGILNSDDYYYHTKVLEMVNNSFVEYPDILFVHGDIYFFDSLYGSNVRKPLLCNIRKAMPYNHPTMFFRKEVYDKFGYYDTSYKYAMDFEFICRLLKELKDPGDKSLYIGTEPMVYMEAGGASWNYELKSIEEYKKALKEHGFWNLYAVMEYNLRVFRTRLKKVFTDLHLNLLVKMWRKNKWKN